MSTLDLLVTGIVAGESASFSNADYRLWHMLPRRVYRTRALNLMSDERRLTNVARPYAHSNPPAQLHPGPGENLEWFAFSLRAHRLVAHGQYERPSDAWTELGGHDPLTIRSRIGTRVALRNLHQGLRPPQSGNDNPHYFDDLGMVRALAALVENPDHAVDAARDEVSATHARDGLWCALATVEFVAGLLDGADVSAAAERAVDHLPDQTWSRRLVLQALDVGHSATGPMDRARRLSVEVGDWLYSYPVAAPETLAFLLAHAAHARTPEDLMLGALQARNAATLPALAGVAAAALFGTDWVPAGLTATDQRLTGLSLTQFEGLTVQEAAQT